MSKNVKRFFVVCFAVLLIIVCAVPVFALPGGVNGYRLLADLDRVTVSYPDGNAMGSVGNSGIPYNTSLGVGTTITGTFGTGYSYARTWQNTQTVYTGSDGTQILNSSMIFNNATAVKFECYDVFIWDSAAAYTRLRNIGWASYNGSLKVRVEYRVYNQNTNQFDTRVQERTTTITSVNNTWTSRKLFEGFGDFTAGLRNLVIIDYIMVNFVPTTAGATVSLTSLPINSNTNIGPIINANSGDITIVEQVVPPGEVDLFQWIIEPLDEFFSIEIADGVTLGGIFIAILGVPLVVILLKVFAGG